MLGGGVSGNPFGNDAETFDTDGTTVITGSTAGAGGSYGGKGGELSPGDANDTYGIPQNPKHVGSGGSRSTS